jgi:3-oxoacyl-[acyl-carrier protein] reductase
MATTTSTAAATAIITGGSAGIGLATARRLHRRGVNVVVCARGQERLDAAVAEVSGEDGRMLGVVADCTQAEDLDHVYDAAVSTYGPVSILINNVGTALRGPFLELTDEQWRGDLDIKLFSAIRLSRRVLADTVGTDRGGRIVNVLSTGGKHPAGGSAPTSVTRAAGLALTKILSKEFAPHGVLVNAVCVGIIKTAQHDERWQRTASDVDRETYYLELAKKRGTPLGRAGEADEVAAVIDLLTSEDGGYVSGTAINVDGGAAPVT